MSPPVIGHVTALFDTIVKQEIDQSSRLSPDQKATVKAGTKLALLSHGELQKGHVAVELETPLANDAGTDKFKDWYGYVGQGNLWQIDLIKEDEAVSEVSSPPISIPTLGLVGLDDYVPGCTWATWREVIQNDPERVPIYVQEVENIIRIAGLLQPWRDKYGALCVTSWLRPPAINRRVGGVSNSRHILGDAVDFWPMEANIFTMQDDMVANWGSNGAVGMGAERRQFIHVDGRGYRVVFGY